MNTGEPHPLQGQVVMITGASSGIGSVMCGWMGVCVCACVTVLRCAVCMRVHLVVCLYL
jgi:NADPH:quinone reductase-like Zn-dependent oxidoreductase